MGFVSGSQRGGIGILRWSAPGDAALATLCTGILAVGLPVTFAGLGADDPRLLVAGGALTAVGLGVLVTADWIDGLVLVALALPLPALYGVDETRLPAVAPLSAVVVAGGVLWVGASRRRFRSGTLPLHLALLLVGAVSLSAVFAGSTLPAVREVGNQCVLLGLFVVAAELLSGDLERIGRLARVLAGVAAVAGVFAALEAVGVLPARFPSRETVFNRATLGFGWPNELGMYMALSLPFAAYVLRTAKSGEGTILGLAAVGGVVLGLICTFSRGSWVAAAVAPAVLLLAGERRYALRIWAVGATAALAFDLASGGALTDRIGATAGDWVVVQRLGLMLTGVLMFRANPVFGVGPGGFAENLDRFGPRIPWLWDYIGSSHNTFIEMAAETGIVGLAAFSVFVGTTFVVVFRAARRWRTDPGIDGDERFLRASVLWAFATFLVMSQFAWSMIHGVGQLVMLVAAMGFGLHRVSGRSS